MSNRIEWKIDGGLCVLVVEEYRGVAVQEHGPHVAADMRRRNATSADLLSALGQLATGTAALRALFAAGRASAESELAATKAKLAEVERERDGSVEQARKLSVDLDVSRDKTRQLAKRILDLRYELDASRELIKAARYYREQYNTGGRDSLGREMMFRALDALASVGTDADRTEAPKYGDDDADDPGCEVCGVATFGARCRKHLYTPEEINAAADAEPPRPEAAESIETALDAAVSELWDHCAGKPTEEPKPEPQPSGEKP